MINKMKNINKKNQEVSVTYLPPDCVACKAIAIAYTLFIAGTIIGLFLTQL